jgi:hypothetical protein
MNRIEAEWHQLKNYESPGRSYDDECELVREILQKNNSASLRERNTQLGVVMSFIVLSYLLRLISKLKRHHTSGDFK